MNTKNEEESGKMVHRETLRETERKKGPLAQAHNGAREPQMMCEIKTQGVFRKCQRLKTELISFILLGRKLYFDGLLFGKKEIHLFAPLE